VNCNLGLPWTVAQDDWLRKHAPTEPAAVLAIALNRSKAAIFHRTRRLGLLKRRRWTAADDQKLRLLWGDPIDRVARELGRTVITVYWRAQKLGLGLGCPQGYERLQAAAVRTGFAIASLRMILGWAKVPIRRAVTRFPSDRGSHIVEPVAVDEAVERWLATETPNAAGRRFGTSGETVARHLEVSGLRIPRKPCGKRHWRVPSATIDRAMAMVLKQGRQLVVVREAA